MKQVFELVDSLANARVLAKGTEANYRRAVVYYGNFLGREASIDDFQEAKVSEWLRSLEGQYPASYIRNLRRDLLVSWRHASDLDLIAYPRTRLIRNPRPEPKEISAWPLEWIPRLLAACDTIEGGLNALACGKRVYASAYFRTQLDLLCRPSDMRALTWTSIASDGAVRWRQSKTSYNAAAKLRSETIAALEKLRPVSDRYRVFPLSKSSTERLIRQVFAEASIAKPAKQSLGHVRHTGGTAIAGEKGNDAARKALGHKPGSKVFESHYLAESASIESTQWYDA